MPVEFIINIFYLMWGLVPIQSLLLILQIWNLDYKFVSPTRHIYGLLTLIGVVFACLSYHALFGYLYNIIFNDVGTFATMKYFIVPFVLCTIMGTIYLIIAFFAVATRNLLILHLSVVVYEILAYYIILPAFNDVDGVFFIFLPVFFFGVEFLPIFQKDKLLWENREKFGKIFNVYVNFAIWIIVTLELTLQLRGYSIIVWK
ncbi:MAG: hypothetical protein ACTSXK_18090 [Promethearchaeota archaeon]